MSSIIELYQWDRRREKTAEVIANAFRKGAALLDDPYAGLNVKDPDGINVQIFDQR